MTNEITRHKSDYVTPVIIEHENNLISALKEAHSSTAQKTKKAGALVLASVVAGLAFVLHGLWSCGGLRAPLFQNQPEYGEVRRIWRSHPISPEAAQKVSAAYVQVMSDYKAIFGKHSVKQMLQYTTCVEELRERSEIYRKIVQQSHFLPEYLTSITNNYVDTLVACAEDLHRLHEQA